MNQQISMADFFGMEASDYLEKLDRLVSGSQRPETNDFVRLARALRGSAMMASQRTIADAAGALEAFARSLHEARIGWDPGHQQLATSAIDDLKVLVRKLSDWTPEDDEKIAALTSELNEVAGSAPPRAKTFASGLDTGTRAFIGREGSAVASALQRASQTAASGRTSADVADSIIQAIQPLRGIASLTEVPPLPDLLDGVDRIATECKRRPNRAIENLRGIFAAAAGAIARVAREVAATGAPDPASPEAAQFAKLLRGAFEGESKVGSIEEFFFDDAGPHIVSQGAGPATAPLSGVELVAHGENLRLAADQLDSATSPAQKDLRLQGLEERLVTLATARTEGLGVDVSQMARQLQATIARIGEGGDTSSLTAHLRQAAAMLAPSSTEPAEAVSGALEAATDASAEAVETVADTAAEAPPEISEVAPIEVEPAAALIASDVPPDAEQDQGGPLDEPPAEEIAGSDLAASYALFEAMLARLGSGEPSLDDLLAGPPAAPAQPAPAPVAEEAPESIAVPEEVPVAIAADVPELPDDAMETQNDLAFIDVDPLGDAPEEESAVASIGATEDGDLPSIEDFLLPEDEPQMIAAEPVAAADADVVPIEQFLVPVTDFCYSGRDALEQARALKSDLRDILDSDNPQRAAEMIEEVLDLIELGLGAEA